MIRFQFFIIWFFFTISASVAQNSFNAQIVIGGLTSQIDGDNYGGFNKFGYHIGAFTTNKFEKSNLYWKLGIQFAEKGSFKPSQPDQGIFNTYKIKLQYVQIPIGITKNLKKFSIDGGITIGALVSASEADENGIVPNTLNYNRMEVAYFLGPSYPINSKFLVSLHYSQSILPIADSLQFNTFGLWGGSFNHVIFFNLHYRFLKNS